MEPRDCKNMAVSLLSLDIQTWGKCCMHKAVEHHSIDSSNKILLTFTLTFYRDQLKFVSILKRVLCNLKDDLVIAC